MTRIHLDDLDTVERPASVAGDAVVSVLRVPPECAGMRLDRFVQSQLRRTSRTRTQKIIGKGAFSPAAKILHASDRVHAQQCILLWRAPWDEQMPSVDLPVLFEDPDLLAIHKPPLVPVHPTARYHKSTVVKILEHARPGERFVLAHRLDRETSGVLLLCRNAEADRHVKAQFQNHTERGIGAVRKHYLAIAWGWPVEDVLHIRLPLELDPTSRVGVKMRVAAEGTGLAARTGFEVLGRRKHPQTARAYALVRCYLETGRQHQIRVHLAAQGFPVVGDKLYGPDDGLFIRSSDGVLTDADRATLELPRHALHAESLELEHPTTKAPLRIVAPMPDDMRGLWDELTASS